MSGPLPEEQRFFDEAVERLKGSRRTFTEQTALQAALRAGYVMSLQHDERFVKAQASRGQYDAHYRLREHRLANQRLFNDLVEGKWDGTDLDGRLAVLDEEEGGHHVFYPHDPRFQLRHGRWEPAVETNIRLTSEQKSELDALLPGLLQSWSGSGSQPWTLRQIIDALKQAGWPDPPNAVRVARAWLLGIEQIRRVGQDFWLPSDQLPAPLKRTQLHVLPIRSMRSEEMRALDEQFRPAARTYAGGNYAPRAPQGADPVSISGEADKMSAHWASTLRTINLRDGFLAVPPGARAVYPALSPGEETYTLIDAMWHEDGERLKLWLDRQQHRLYGSDLLRKIEWDYSPGDILRIAWTPDILTIYVDGHNDQVQQEEARLIDPTYLKELRGGLGEAYRDSLQTILSQAPNGLTRQEIVRALSERLGHTVHHGTIFALLYAGGFVQRDRRWFAAPDASAGRRTLRTAIIATMQPRPEEPEEHPPSLREHIHRQTQAIMRRLEEIERSL